MLQVGQSELIIKIMKTIQIACVPENWDNSTITAVGTARNGRAALPKSTVAKDLPEPWLSVWHAIVQELQKLDPNGWAATFILVDKQVRTEYPEPNEGEAEQEPGPEPTVVEYIHLTINRRWDDNTTAEPVALGIEDENAVALFGHLTADEVTP